ncbi:sorting nexin-31 [Hyperolius riggenbachi]|uniref:sorting nexin-31 n=1 Tax=Hyperolius riggenbachi TaxID=752182 RepID=UPI0035A2F0CB
MRQDVLQADVNGILYRPVYFYRQTAMHVSIPVTEELLDTLGGRYVLYSVYLEGFLLFKVRYKDLHFWDEQMQRIFGSSLPIFPPKYLLAMTKSMAEKRRTKLEIYLQEIVSDLVVSSSDIFIEFFKKHQMETFKIPTIRMILKVYLPGGQQVQVDSLSSDTAERVLESALYKVGLSRELTEYFSLFITHRDDSGVFTVVKRIAHFEIPFLTVWKIKDDHFQIDIRKWYMDPSTDAMLIGCKAAIDVLYCQAVEELEMNWSEPTEEQRQKLQHCIKTEDKIKFLELMHQVEHYGYLKLSPCTKKQGKTSSTVTVYVGGNELHCSSETESLHLPIYAITRWHVNMQNENLCKLPSEFKLEYKQGQDVAWITLWTEQAFLLSSCLKKIISEQPEIATKENLEIIDPKKSRSLFRRTQKQADIPKEKVSFSSFVGQSDVFESEDFSL